MKGTLSRSACLPLALALAVALMLGSNSTPAKARPIALGASPTCTPFQLFKSPTPTNVLLEGLSVVSATDIWAVGAHFGIRLTPPVIEHWDGLRWTRVDAASTKGYFSAVWAVTSDDVWAVGYSPVDGPDIFDPLIEHWDGTAWTQVPAPTPPGSMYILGDVVAVSSSDAWAVEYYMGVGGRDLPLTMHWNGVSWATVPAPPAGVGANILGGVWAASMDEVWAVGLFEPTAFESAPLIEHWDGAAWSLVDAAPPPSGDLNRFFDVFGTSSSDVWAVGFWGVDPSFPLAEHWDGTAWNWVNVPAQDGAANEFAAIWALTPSDVWAVVTR